MKTERTPGPWRVKDVGSNVILSDDPNDDLVATTRLYSDHGKANAAFIVKACNAHDELVAALLAVVARLDQPVFNGTESAGHQAANILRADIRSALSAARAALAKVSE